MKAVSSGEGPAVLFIHGSAADQTTWGIQRSSLASQVRVITYDRRGTGDGGEAEGRSVEAHAGDAAEILREHAPEGAVIVGSSFGAVIALELCRRHPELAKAAVLIEPPLGATDEGQVVAGDFLVRYERLVEEEGGPAAAELFLRTVLGDALFEKIPKPYQERSKALWRPILEDARALAAYRVRYATLPELRMPILLCGGERSAPFYRPTLEALQRALGDASLEMFPAGHMLHAEAYRRFNARLLELVRRVNA